MHTSKNHHRIFGRFLQIAINLCFPVRCQQGWMFRSGCYSNLKEFITTFVSYFQTKNFKGTFLIYWGAFHQGRNRGRGQFEYPPQNTLSASGTPVRRRLKWKHALPSLHQKQMLRVCGNKHGIASGCFKTKTNRARKKRGASKKHLSPSAHVVGPNSGSPNKTISSAARAYAKTLSLVLFHVSSDEYKRTAKGKSIPRLVAQR